MKASFKLILLAVRKTFAVMCFTLCFTLAAGFLSILALVLAVAPRSYLENVVGVIQAILKPFLRFDVLRALHNTTSTSFDHDTSEHSRETSRAPHLFRIAS